ncbi:MAG TPA: hypothetical protein ENN63_09725 [Bacteroidetes bacterium]|nr:hypothetical protein [Bacteroidota bacterium]
MITGKTKMADLIHLNHKLLPVIGRFGISLGFGDSTVNEICRKKGIETAFFLEVVNAFHDPDYYPQENLRQFSLQLIVDYLRNTHRFYLDKKIPEIEEMIEAMIRDCYPGKEHIDLIKVFFGNYRKELIAHIEREEETVFPYALMVEEAFLKGSLTGEQREQIRKRSMKDYQEEHDDIEEKLYDLKNIIIKYLPQPQDVSGCTHILYELFYLEQDINDHSRIEDKVLAPKVEQMEKVLLERYPLSDG